MFVGFRSGRTLYLCLAVIFTAIIAFAVSCSLNPHGNSGSGRGIFPFAGSAMTVSGGGYNYGEALQKAVMFYEFQRSGKITPSLTNGRMNWRGDSDLLDGSDNGLDLTGGWHDAGDHVKFNLPMSYSVSMLSWAIYEYGASIKTSGQYDALTNNIKWATDYLLKCSAGSAYYYQVGSGGNDHSWWGPCEVNPTVRPSYSLTGGGAAVVGETAAALAAAAWVFQNGGNSSYASTLLARAETLYASAAGMKSDTTYNSGAASGYYNSSSWADDLSWAAVWIYLAGGGSSYLSAAQSWTNSWPVHSGTTQWDYAWTQCWDDVHYGAQLLLAKITGLDAYRSSVEANLQYWTTGYGGTKITYTPEGLAWLSQWGSLRYASSEAFLAFVYSDWTGAATSNLTTYRNFAEAQINYALGATGRSYLVGFGTNPPQHPHHRTAESSWANDMTIPPYARHTLYGALVGGPDSSDSYTDSDQNYTQNEPACDYNAGFIASLSRMYKVYGGSPILNFTGAIEVPSNTEFFVQTQPNSTGPNYFEVAAWLNNMSGWPARPGTNLSFRYFINTSELVANGYSDTNVAITVNYNQGNATVTPYLIPWDPANHIYYVNVSFGNTNIYPGGQGIYQMQVQFRMAGPQNTSFWSTSKDWSYLGGMTTNNPNQNVPVYMSGVKIYGNEPTIGSSSSSSSSSVVSSSPSSSSSSSSIITSSSLSSSSSSTITSSSSISSSSSSIASSSSSSSSSSSTAITAPFSYTGAGEFYWQTTSIPNFENNWNNSTLTINGVSFLNVYASASQLPAKINGYYYIHYVGPYPWSHFECQ
ncbi:MAG: glycoside hydrolase family 9 protein [Brevinematales bacterium]|jgi:hypothetical protein